MYLPDFLRSPNFSTGGAVLKGRLVSEEVTVVYSSERDAAERSMPLWRHPGCSGAFLTASSGTWSTIRPLVTGS